MKTLISIVGPTAIGKTSLGISLANHFNTEIISADSRQFFKEMSIGTAKPTQQELSEAKHHLVDCLSINEFYTAGQFEKQALEIIANIHQKNDVAIMVGGSGLYVNAVINGIDDIPSNKEIREELNLKLAQEGIEPLQEQLKQLDELHYNAMDIHNPQRLVRALEVCLTSGKTYTSFKNKSPKKRPFNVITIGLTADRELIYNRINTRVDVMIKAGLIEEVKRLIPQQELNALQTVGYRELFSYFKRDIILEEAINLIKQNTRRFAKRQLTWFKKNEQTSWFDIDKKDEIIPYLETILSK